MLVRAHTASDPMLAEVCSVDMALLYSHDLTYQQTDYYDDSE